MIGVNKIGLLLFVMIFVEIGLYNGIGYASEVVKPRIPGYPVDFSGVGRVDRVGGAEIVINDHLYKLSNRLVSHTPTSKNVGLSVFREGDTAGFIIESERVIKSLWLLKSISAVKMPSIRSEKDQRDIHKENGVWRN